MVSDVHRITPDLICIHNFEEMLQYWEWIKSNPRPGSPGLYVLHQEYQECPLFQDSVFNKHAGQQFYSIRQRFGGPSIELTYYTLVGQGNLSHYPYYYYESEEYSQIRPPEVMIQFYKDFCKYIRQTTKVIKYYNRKVYCGAEYIRQVIDGTINVDEEFREIVLGMLL